MSGVVGLQKPKFDVWGETVNMAARMMQISSGGEIICSSEVRNEVKDVLLFSFL